MLCLTRTPSENIRISEEISITVLGINGNQVRFGIEAPADLLVLREELLGRTEKKDVRDSDDDSVPDDVATIADDNAQPKITYKRRKRQLKPNKG
ncbi:MAG: carbon storage regulator [Candidatus Thiodiazotropha sp.]